jgi:hypothetical protein
MYTDFGKGKFDSSELITAYSYRFNPTLPFVQRDDCIEAPKCADYRDGYASISLLDKNKRSGSVTIHTECDFEGIAAPLIVIAEDVRTDENGVIRYDNYFEVVIYKNGINIWRLWPENGKIVHKNLLRLVYPLETGKKHPLTVTVTTDSISAETNGVKATVPVPDMFETFYTGVTACEGLCRFYNLETK